MAVVQAPEVSDKNVCLIHVKNFKPLAVNES